MRAPGPGLFLFVRSFFKSKIPILVLLIGPFIFSVFFLVLFDCTFLRICPFLPGCPFYCIATCCSILKSFVLYNSWFSKFSFFHFWLIDLNPPFFSWVWLNILSILSFSKNQILVFFLSFFTVYFIYFYSDLCDFLPSANFGFCLFFL